MEPVSHLDVELPRFDEVSPAKRVAVVEQEATVRDVDALDCQQPVLAETLTQRQINQRVPRQVGRTAGIGEAGAVMQVRGHKGPPRKIDREAGVERIALIVIQ